MKKSPRTKMKPVKAWALVFASNTLECIYYSRASAKFAGQAYNLPKGWRIARVEIREIAPKIS